MLTSLSRVTQHQGVQSANLVPLHPQRPVRHALRHHDLSRQLIQNDLTVLIKIPYKDPQQAIWREVKDGCAQYMDPSLGSRRFDRLRGIRSGWHLT